ncbi:ABC transporter ATP-binding protein [Devosia riboflavina]
MSHLLETHDLTVGYRSRGQTRAVLRDINVQVAPGGLVCLLGVNGIGKSTLMRTLARMEPALAGSVEINGTDITRMSQYDLARHVAVVLTERVAIGSMPAFKLVELGRYPHVGWSGTLSGADREIVRDAIVAVGAEHLAHREITELSDGERQRIMIARALAQRPAVLLLDEPAAFLDVSARVEMIATLRKLAREQNVAVILSSHDLRAVAAHGRHDLVDRRGRADAYRRAGRPAGRRQHRCRVLRPEHRLFGGGSNLQDPQSSARQGIRRRGGRRRWLGPDRDGARGF